MHISLILYSYIFWFTFYIYLIDDIDLVAKSQQIHRTENLSNMMIANIPFLSNFCIFVPAFY
jgi:hypothetical protein